MLGGRSSVEPNRIDSNTIDARKVGVVRFEPRSLRIADAVLAVQEDDIAEQARSLNRQATASRSSPVPRYRATLWTLSSPGSPSVPPAFRAASAPATTMRRVPVQRRRRVTRAASRQPPACVTFCRCRLRRAVHQWAAGRRSRGRQAVPRTAHAALRPCSTAASPRSRWSPRPIHRRARATPPGPRRMTGPSGRRQPPSAANGSGRPQR